MDNKGGRVSITIGGVTYAPREASVKVSPSRVSMENGANGDGSGYSTVKSKLASADITFDRGKPSAIQWTDAMILSSINVTIVEIDTGVTHLFTGARWSGEPELDLSTGEVSGLKIETDVYTQI
jgi:hypothetical protein